MRFIAHRGNINGPCEDENKPEHILNAFKGGYDVETDVWVVDNTLYLGHDKPEYKIEKSFLELYKENLWLHAKNREALEYLFDFNIFWHKDDDYTITSRNIIWAYPGKHTTGVYVLPERYNTIIDPNALGVCTDYCRYYKENLIQMPFTFGIITDGNADSYLETIIKSIKKQNMPFYEIIIVGNSRIIDKDVKIIPFDENIKKAWITKKKNIIAQQAKYENIVLLHDYIMFDEDWYFGYLKYSKEEDFQVTSNKIMYINNKRFRDWCLFHGFLKGWWGIPKHRNCDALVNTGCLLPYSFKSNEKINKYIYYSGGYFVVKKEWILKYPLNERLSWGEDEDTEWCRILSDKCIFKFNRYSTVRLIKEKNESLWQEVKDISLL